MKWGRRQAEPPREDDGSSGHVYRVAVSHSDEKHPSSAPSHWGPAYDSAYAEVAAHVHGITPGEVDLLGEALSGAARARDEYREFDGWQVWVEQLSDGEWVKVG